MPVGDQFVPLRDWRSSLYRGDQTVIACFLDVIDATLPAAWVRDCNYERSRLRPDRVRCYLFDQPGDAAVRLWLVCVTATRVRGGPIQLVRQPASAGTKRVEQLVSEFTDRCVLTAARMAGVQCTRPEFGSRSAIASDVEMLFTQFADTADGQWPLGEQAEALWDELISSCLAAQVAIDRTELERWAAASGWEQNGVTALVDRFYKDSVLLAKRLAVTAP